MATSKGHWLKAGESAEGMTEQDPNLSEPDPIFNRFPFASLSMQFGKESSCS